MNGQDQYASERGVGGFQEFASFPNTCANCWPLRSSTWRPLAGRLGSLLEVPWWALGSQFGRRGAPLGLALLEVSWRKSPGTLNGSLCWPAVSMDEPEVRRVGFASFALLPPSRARAPLLLWGRGSSGSGGGLCAMLEKPKFVPMARPYAFHIPIFIYL